MAIFDFLKKAELVTPLAGVWVEMSSPVITERMRLVTPLAGVWVEISGTEVSVDSKESLPLRECGLKSEFLVCIHSRI